MVEKAVQRQFVPDRRASIVGEAGNNQLLQVCKEKGWSGFSIFNFYDEM